ncbi:hypothetical protein BUALT_Bualt01G0093500 [Buddleja alternifolia]|uniref:Uncharacterized protein n=1 Tax=Buddleja alternifolia TaxID=168488 RepID=A0AAV6Y6T4_9LAMI|nr:hypothetical protein BUALT_Bualt01G0093500 [Buddleja alternifolia]
MATKRCTLSLPLAFVIFFLAVFAFPSERKKSGMQLEQCVYSTLCLENKPKVVVGLREATSNIFVDNPSYRDFLFQTFGVSSADMESTAVVMTSLSIGFPLPVVRGLLDLAGA